MNCILCGRKTQPAVMLGDKAVGPKCARKAGLIERGRRMQGMVRLVAPVRRARDPETLDLCSEVA